VEAILSGVQVLLAVTVIVLILLHSAENRFHEGED